jgi:hypothetical protein
VWDTHQDLAVCFTWKQAGLEFLSFASKLVEERRWVVNVASSRMSYRSKAKDGRLDGIGCSTVKVGPNYPLLDIIFLLAHMSILVFYFHYK